MTTPFQCFVLKVHSRCNLACDYCYEYEMADQSWRLTAKAMSPQVVDQTAFRIGEHVRSHDVDAISVVLHGGEPLLAGADRIRRIVAARRREVPAATQIALSVQTNGLLLDEPMLDALFDLGIRVGVSIDGGEAANDRHRRFRDGRGSHTAVAASLERLRGNRWPGLYAGLLCTVDIANDPIQVYEALLEHRPPAIDFLLPHGNWSEPPPHRTPDAARTPYGDWLAAAFDRWYDAPKEETRVRFFEDIMIGLLGGPSHSEQIGTSPSAVVVVATDGEVEQVDTLKSAYEGATKTGTTVFTDSFDTALRHPAIAARQLGTAGLCDRCQGCGLRDVCGGGYYPHRYRADNGFRNPSVYCPDLIRIIEHVRGRIAQDVDVVGT